MLAKELKKICLYIGKRIKREECLCPSKDTYLCECKENLNKECIPNKTYPICNYYIEELLEQESV